MQSGHQLLETCGDKYTVICIKLSAVNSNLDPICLCTQQEGLRGLKAYVTKKYLSYRKKIKERKENYVLLLHISCLL